MKKTPLVLLLGVLVGCGGGAPEGETSADSGSADPIDSVSLTYEGEGMILEGATSVCQVRGGQMLTTGTQLPPGAPQELTLLFLAPRDTDFSGLANHGSMTGMNMYITGAFDLVDLEDALRQVISAETTCESAMTFIQTESVAPGITVDRYRHSFKCPVVPYGIVTKAESNPVGQAVLTDFSGEYECRSANR